MYATSSRAMLKMSKIEDREGYGWDVCVEKVLGENVLIRSSFFSLYERASAYGGGGKNRKDYV